MSADGLAWPAGVSVALGMRVLTGFFDEPEPARCVLSCNAQHTRDHIAAHLEWLAKQADDLGRAPLSSDAFGGWLLDEAARLRIEAKP